jgi:hypothetical protein
VSGGMDQRLRPGRRPKRSGQWDDFITQSELLGIVWPASGAAFGRGIDVRRRLAQVALLAGALQLWLVLARLAVDAMAK